MPKHQESVAVIGAGLAGLAAAAKLAHNGHRVSLFDQLSRTGGKAGTETIADVRFDTGPSLLTLTSVFDEYFSSLGESFSDYVDIEPLDPLCSYWFADGSFCRAPGTLDGLRSFLIVEFGEEEKKVDRFFSYIEGLYNSVARVFLHQPIHEGRFYRSKQFWNSLPKLIKLDPFRTMMGALRSFFSNPKTLQFFGRYATYNGSNPYQTPATMLLIPYVEYAFGGYGVRQGIFGIPQALEKLARKKGVSIEVGRKVDKILWEKAKVRGVVVGGEELLFDRVVSNADVSTTYEDLIGEPLKFKAYQRYKRREPSSSGLVFYFVIDTSFDSMESHNIFFSPDYKKEFDQIFSEGTTASQPTIYVNIGSRISPQDSPNGYENWFVLMNTPPFSEAAPWDRWIEEARSYVVSTLGRHLSVDLEQHIVAESKLSPRDIEEQTSSAGGSLYGISSNTPMAAFARHRNRSTELKGLYFCGGSAHPGGGMPLVTLSGSMTADIILDRQGKGKL